MWKKLHRPRDTAAPTAVENDPGHTATDQLSNRPDTAEEEKPGLPPLPFRSMEPSHQPRVASSIYSQRHSLIENNGNGNQSLQTNDPYSLTARESQYQDVSPPVSPLQAPEDNVHGSSDVSPIDDTPGRFDQFPRTETKPVSSLPVPRKDVNPHHASGSTAGTRPSPKTKTNRSSDASRLTKWDDFSGEPTTSEKGKEALAAPGRMPLGKQAPQKPQFSILNKGRELNKAGRRLLESRRHNHDGDPAAHAPPPREPWKGQSGRSTLVNPVQSKKDARVQPLSVPPRKDSKQRPDRKPVTSSIQASKSKTPKSKKGGSEETILPVVPPKDNVGGAVGSGGHDDRKPLPTPSQDDGLTGNQRGEPNPDFVSRFQDTGLDQQPASRFSMTTYATTEVGSPPGSPTEARADKDHPPLPALPPESTSRAVHTAKVAARKPTPSEVPNVKTLPRSPEETQAENRIDALKARTNDLARRRGNINTIIHELTQVIQPSSIAYDMATRGEVKKTVESLNDELAEIKKEEHEIGMKLMRAYKKQEQEDYYGETSALWIKRVAS